MSPKGDLEWLLSAIEHSRRCEADRSAYSVGAILVRGESTELSRGFSREGGSRLHAEEAALSKIKNDLSGVTLYSSMEPCSERLSGRKSCCELLITAGVKRVVFAAREPQTFVECRGREMLKLAGLEVLEFQDLAYQVAQINSHIWS